MPSQDELLPTPRFSLWAAAAIVAALLLLWRGLPRPGEPPRGHRTLLHEVRLLGPDDAAPGPVQDLLWEDGRILKIGPPGSLGADHAFLVQGHGRVAAPALADAAVFLSLEGRQLADSVAASPRNSLERQAEAGVGLVLDLNAHRAFIQAARGLDGRLPEAQFAGALFTSPGGWRLMGQTPWDSNLVELIEPEDLDAPWSLALRFGDQAAFATVENEGLDGLSIPLPTLRRLGALAHAQGLPFIIHAEHSAKALEALAAGPDAILGPLFDAGDGRLAEAMRRQGVLYIPALSALLNSFCDGPLRAWLGSFPAAQSIAPATLDAASDPARVQALVKHWNRQGADPKQALAVPAALAAAGVKLAFGTASGRPLVFHGLGAQTEVWHLARAGFGAGDILAMSQRSRELLGRKPGGLKPGARADLQLLAEDPGVDANALARPVEVFLGGLPLRP